MSLSQLPPSVTVVTATRGRPRLLARAMDSVVRQCCNHVAQHIVLADDCEETVRSLEPAATPARVTVRLVPRGGHDSTGPRRLGELRDLGARIARTRWLAYIDDDNEWTPDHLHSLLELAGSTRFRAVHSWMQVVHRDGTPYVEEYFPWAPDEESGRAEYRRMVRLGVIEPGQNVFRDRFDVESGPEAVRSVDVGEWLLATDLVRDLGFTAEYSEEDVRAALWEDDKFMERLLRRKIPVASTERPTVVYRLGGLSTGRAERMADRPSAPGQAGSR